jgi:serine/threonine-protein kinase
VDAVVLKALSKNRMNRYQSAGEMRADLLRAASGRPVAATPVLREEDRVAAYAAPPPPRVMGNRNTGTMARVGNTRRRRASTWVLVALSLLGLLAVVALGAGIYLANQTPTATVPPLVGGGQDAAKALLDQAKLKGQSTPGTSEGCEPGKVLNQSPDAGRKVPEGSTVTYAVCQGPGSVQVPAGLVGQDVTSASKAITDAGLVPAVTKKDSDKPKDTVLSVDPVDGTSLAKGSKVTLTVSLGNMGPVPDLSKLSRADATAKLRAAGFNNSSFKARFTTEPTEYNIVLDQDPPAGEVHKFTDAINVFYGMGPTAAPTTPAPSTSSSG